MRKRVESLGEQIWSVKLYMDDIVQIVEVLKELSKDVQISAHDYELDDLNQLADLKRDVITKMAIQTSTPYVSLDIGPSKVWLYIARDEPASRGAFEKIKAILRMRRRKFAWLLHNTALSGALVGIGFVTAVAAFREPGTAMSLLGAALCILGSLWMRYGVSDRFNRYAVVVPKHRIEDPTFLKRNQDKIILAVVSAILSSIATYFACRLFSPPP